MGSFFKKGFADPFLGKISQECVAPFSGGGRLLSILLILVCLGVNVYVRLFPAYLPQLREQAALNAINQPPVQQAASGPLGGPQGNAPENRAAATLASVALDRQIAEEYEKLKDPYQDPNGQTYFMESDPYTWVQWTKNIVINGHPGDTKVNGESYDSYILAPWGGGIPRQYRFLLNASAVLYRALNFYVSLPLERFLFYVPVFYAAVFLLTFYFFMRRWSTDLAAFVATFLMGMTGVFIERTCAGWYDSDSLNLFLALAITGLLLEALRAGSSKLQWLFFTVLAAFFQGAFMSAWMGWWFITLILAAFFLLSCVRTILCCYREPRRLLKEILFYGLTGAVFFITADCFGYWFSGLHLMASVSDWGYHSLAPQRGISLAADIWPNTFYTVSELTSMKLQDVAGFFYNRAVFVAAVAGLCALVWRERCGMRKEVMLMMLCWFMFMIVAAMKSQRFTFLLCLPVFFFLGVFIGDFLPALFSRMAMGWKRLAATLAFVSVIAYLILTAGKSGIARAEGIYPMMNDSWYKALTYVDQRTPREGILNAWWDYGNWFKYYGKRRVIFDAQTQLGQLSYWMARVLFENDEARAIAILRLLNNASGRAYDELLKIIPAPFQCEKVLERLLSSNRQEGARILEGYPDPSGAIPKVLDFLYARPDPAYFIVDRSLISKISNISFLGNWDFSRAFAYAHRYEARGDVVSALEKDFELAPKKAEWIANIMAAKGKAPLSSELFSRRFSFSSEPLGGKTAGRLTFFDNGVVYDQDSRDVLFYDAEKRKYLTPRKVIFYETGVAREIKNENGDYDKTIVVVSGPEKDQAFIADDALAASLFVKLYFLGGAGLRSFKPFYSDDEKGIYIYEIDWNSK